jgi:mono/diheme cytochrome c family protein
LRRSPLVLAAALALAGGCAGSDPSPQRLYQAFCARCHGKSGEGDGKSLRLHPFLDLRRSPMIRRGDREAIRQRIAFGDGPMPGFAHRLNPAQIEALVELTLRFASPNPRPETRGPSP